MVTFHQRHYVRDRLQIDCLFNSLFMQTTKKQWKLPITDVSCNPPLTGRFPSLRQVMWKDFPCTGVCMDIDDITCSVVVICFLWTTILSDELCAWWRHQMEIISAFLAIFARNSPVAGEFPAQRPVTRSFDVIFDQHLNKMLSKQSWGWWFETPSSPLWRHSDEYSKWK